MKTIVWDVDDVLNDLMRVWFEQFWLPIHPKCTLKYEQIRENPPYRLLGVTLEQYLASLDEFRLSGRYDKLEPIREVKGWFIEHGAKCRHVALTKIPVIASPISAAWVMRHFGTWIRSFHFVPSRRAGENAPQYDENKGTHLNNFGRADLFVDDTLGNIEEVNKTGVKTKVFPRPWNGSQATIKQLLDEITAVVSEEE